MKGTAGTLPCPAAERGHQVSAPHLCPARPEPTRLQCRERASVPWKVVLRPPAEGREAGEAGGREAARGVGWHIGVFGRTRLVLRCPSAVPEAVPPSPGRGVRCRHPAAPAARQWCQRPCRAPQKVSSGARGREERQRITAGRERGEGEAAFLCCREQWVPRLPPGWRERCCQQFAQLVSLRRCFHSGLLQRSRIKYLWKCNVGIFNGYMLLFCEIYLPPCFTLVNA